MTSAINLILAARELVSGSKWGENKEYERALIELIIEASGVFSFDDYETIERIVSNEIL